jgi:hypothetical protein
MTRNRTRRSFCDSSENSEKATSRLPTRFVLRISRFTHQNGRIGRRGSREPGSWPHTQEHSIERFKEHSTTLSLRAIRSRYDGRLPALGSGNSAPRVPAYGEKVTVGSMSWYRFVERKIVEDWGTEVFWPSGTPESEVRDWTAKHT